MRDRIETGVIAPVSTPERVLQGKVAVVTGGSRGPGKAMAVEWAQHNVRVNCIAPAYFDVGVSEPALKTRWVYKEIIRRTPMKRVGQASELTGAVLFLASDASSYVTGHTLYVDGGWHAA